MEPIPTEVSPGKISMCSIICNVLYMHICAYVCILCWDFSEPIDWHLAVLHVCIRTYVTALLLYVHTVLLSLASTVYIHIHICTYTCIYAYVLVYIRRDLYCTYVILSVKIMYRHMHIQNLTYIINLY